METIFENKKVRIGFFLSLFFLTLLGNCGNRRNKKEITDLQKEIDSLRIEISNHPTHDELAIEGLKISKRTLYDWNSVVRTSVRPDDRMNQYDEEIKNLESKK
jgi:hypothetical protein